MNYIYFCKNNEGTGSFIEEAEWYKNKFEKLIFDVVNISPGEIRPTVLNSGKIVTEYTLSTENKTEELA